jgi:hypothetical protein
MEAAHPEGAMGGVADSLAVQAAGDGRIADCALRVGAGLIMPINRDARGSKSARKDGGDGEDFCYVRTAIGRRILAAFARMGQFHTGDGARFTPRRGG